MAVIAAGALGSIVIPRMPCKPLILDDADGLPGVYYLYAAKDTVGPVCYLMFNKE
jgi:hypothetical protein